MEEIWKDVVGFERMYKISNFGRVKSIRLGKEKILKQGKDGHGYLHVNLCGAGVNKVIKIHRLVAIAFLQNPLNLPTVNHKNENKEDNSVENLEWMSYSDNNNYGNRNKKASEKMSLKVVQILNGVEINIFPSLMYVKRELGFDASHISKCCLGKRKSANGYQWRYLNGVRGQ